MLRSITDWELRVSNWWIPKLDLVAENFLYGHGGKTLDDLCQIFRKTIQNMSFFSKYLWKGQWKSHCLWSLWVLKKLHFYFLNEPWESRRCSAARKGQTLFRNLVRTHSFLLPMGIKAYDLIVNTHWKEDLSPGKFWFPAGWRQKWMDENIIMTSLVNNMLYPCLNEKEK